MITPAPVYTVGTPRSRVALLFTADPVEPTRTETASVHTPEESSHTDNNLIIAETIAKPRTAQISNQFRTQSPPNSLKDCFLEMFENFHSQV